MHNPVIRVAITVSRITLILTAITFTLFIGVVIYWQFVDIEVLENWKLVNPFQAGSGNLKMQRGPNAEGITFNQIGSTMVLWLVIRTSIFFVLVWLALKEVIKILIAIRQERTFFSENISHFQRLGTIGFLFSLFSLFNFGTINEQTTFYFAIPFEPILFSLGAWVLAEIFREGGKFREDSNSII